MRIRRILESDHLSGWAFAFPAVFLIFVFGIVPVMRLISVTCGLWSGIGVAEGSL